MIKRDTYQGDSVKAQEGTTWFPPVFILYYSLLQAAFKDGSDQGVQPSG
jgi:hypothetical protein